MKRTILFTSFLLLCLTSSALVKDSLSVGINWNYRSKYMKNAEVYILFRDAVAKASDSRIGINVRNYPLVFDGVRNLQASSLGLVGEQSLYVYKKILFLGLRFDLSADWLSKDSKDKIELERQYTMPNFYYDFTGYLEAGVNLKLVKGCNIKLSVMPGIEDRGITNELFHIGTSNQDNIVREEKNVFVIQAGLSIEFKLKN